MTETLTKEQIQEKADELSKQFSVTVTPLVFVEPETNEQIVGFVKEPNRMVKKRVLDKSLMSPVTAADELFEMIIIKEASDPRITSELPENDKYNLGAVMACMSLITYSQNTFKKK